MADRLPIVDPHMHLWDLDRYYYAWLQDDPLPLNPAGDISLLANRSYGLDDYRAHAADYHVLGTVHVECGLPPEDSLGETEWLERLAAGHAFDLAIVAGARLEDAAAERLLEAQAQHPSVRGIRQILNWHEDSRRTYTPADLLQSAAWQRGFALLARLGLSFDLQIYPSQMQAAAGLAARHAETPIILNHTGMPTDRDSAGIEAWSRGMALLAEQPNIRVKISGLGMVDRSWSEDSIRPFVLRTIDLFGPGRCMFASNFPVDSIHGDFARHYQAFDRITAGFSAADRRALFCATACDTYLPQLRCPDADAFAAAR
jgi:predicted TIM-barrel fold metal-dependent hydrolase